MMEFCEKRSGVSSRVLKSRMPRSVKLFRSLIEIITVPNITTCCSFADANSQRVVRRSGRRCGANTSFESGMRMSECDRDVRAVDNCIIGAHTMVLPLATIGDGCTIGAASLAMRKVPAGSLLTGNPAQVVRGTVQTTQFDVRVSE
jgi:acetyltransferase-like isoleucine patch superfamily enzyme